ncbi:hypothetical protein DIPPA_32508 [Diplonema papillatum]|nr:hypothetical protein DIPPA_32508 [Diplonema papillatum]
MRRAAALAAALLACGAGSTPIRTQWQTGDGLLLSASLDTFSITYYSSNVSCHAGDVVAPRRNQRFQIEGECPFTAEDVTQVACTMVSTFKDGWEIDSALLESRPGHWSRLWCATRNDWGGFCDSDPPFNRLLFDVPPETNAPPSSSPPQAAATGAPGSPALDATGAPPSTRTTRAPEGAPTLFPASPAPPLSSPATPRPAAGDTAGGTDATETAVAVAVAVSVAGSVPGAAIGAGKLAVLMGSCHGELEDLSRAISVTQWDLGGVNGRYVGCVAGNGLVLAAVSAVHIVLSFLVGRLAVADRRSLNRARRLLSAQGLLRFPAVTLFVLVALMQGFVTCGSQLLLYHTTRVEMAIGAVTVVAMVCFPIANYLIIARYSGSVVYQRDPRTGRGLAFFVGACEWVDRNRDFYFLNRFGTMFQRYVPAAMVFMTVECWHALSIGFVGAIRTRSSLQCGHKRVAMLFLVLMQGVIVLAVAPSRLPVDNVLEVLTACSSAAGCMCAALAYYSGKSAHWGFAGGASFFEVSGYLILTRSVFSVACVVYVALTKRKERLEQQHRNTEAEERHRLALIIAAHEDPTVPSDEPVLISDVIEVATVSAPSPRSEMDILYDTGPAVTNDSMSMPPRPPRCRPSLDVDARSFSPGLYSPLARVATPPLNRSFVQPAPNANWNSSLNTLNLAYKPRRNTRAALQMVI